MAAVRGTGAATLRDVARVAGVSPSTASRVLNGGEKFVSEALETRVLAVAEALGYVSNQAARALRGRRTAVVLLASDPRTASMAAMAAGMEEAGHALDVLVSITAVGSDVSAHVTALRTLRSLRPRALVIPSASLATSADELIVPELALIEGDGGAVVFVGEHELPYPSVRFDDVQIGQAVGRHMGGLRRGRAAILTTQGHPALEARTRGFLEGLAQYGFEKRSVAVEPCELSRHGGREAAIRLARSSAPPDLLLAGNDVLAIGAISGLQQLGIEVPRQVAVSGVDDIPIAREITPALTTVRLDFFEAGRAALQMALSQGRPGDVHLPGTLVERASTALPIED